MFVCAKGITPQSIRGHSKHLVSIGLSEDGDVVLYIGKVEVLALFSDEVGIDMISIDVSGKISVPGYPDLAVPACDIMDHVSWVGIKANMACDSMRVSRSDVTMK